MNRIYSLADIDPVVRQVVELMAQVPVITFTGPLGAGKTTIIRKALQLLGVLEPITSPTFTYVNVYTLADGRTLYHFDLYRIQTQDDFIAAGFNEYLYADNSVSVIEWPQVIWPLLQKNVCHCTLDYNSMQDRKITIECR